MSHQLRLSYKQLQVQKGVAMDYLYENDGSPYKLTMSMESEEFSFSEFDELPDDGEFENIEDEVAELDFNNFEYSDDLESYEDDE
jgi:hypothetical protein